MANRTLYTGARLVDGRGGPAVVDAALLVEGERIAQVGPAASIRLPEGRVEQVDLGGQTLIPGLIDCHVHFTYSLHPSLAAIDREDLELTTLKAARNAETLLQAGYTSVREVGCRGNLAAAVRDAIRLGLVSGPRVVAAGQIITTTAGLLDLYPAWLSNRAGMGRVADGPEEIVKAVREQIKLGVDHVKLEASGAAVGAFARSWEPTMSYQELVAAREAAARYGRPVAIHAEAAQAIEDGLRAGVHTIEHGTYVTDEALRMWRDAATILVPTLCISHSFIERGRETGAPQSVIDEFKLTQPTWIESFGRAYAAGVKIATGSDIGNRYPHGWNAKEIELFVRYGMSPSDAIVAATRNAAEVLRLSDQIGTLEPGKYADFLVVDGDPLADVTVLQRRDRLTKIVKGGLDVKKVM
ncbi:MAG: amidohydrolase family protein [Chloroflexi bacterium]|nr:amidohydrolase family protein [Chloroflexota bacterium]